MTDHDLLMWNYQTIQAAYHLSIALVFLTVLALVVSLAKLAMVRSLREEVRQNTETSRQYLELGQQFADLYRRENREAQHTVVNAAAAMTETARQLTDEWPITSPEQLAKAKERLARYEAAHPELKENPCE